MGAEGKGWAATASGEIGGGRGSTDAVKHRGGMASTSPAGVMMKVSVSAIVGSWCVGVLWTWLFALTVL